MNKDKKEGKNEIGKKRIMLITPMLHQGGFERICVFTARLLKDLYDVYLVVFSTKDIFYDVSGLHLIDLDLGAAEGKAGKAVNLYRRVKRLKNLKKELGIDITYSFGTTANLANVLSKGKDTTWAGIRGYNALSDRGAGLIFRRADCVVSCTRIMEDEINSAFRTKRSCTLYNPCSLEEIRELSRRETDEGTEGRWKDFVNRRGALIVSMGREDDLKGFWHLLKCFAVVKREIPDARLMIIGDGSYAEYRKLAEDLGIMESVCFTGALKNPFPLLARADVYALTSVSEGFPNAMIEAMVCGVPCISVNCKTGPSEILQEDHTVCLDRHKVYHADYGILAPIFEGEKDLNADTITAEEEIFAQELKNILTDRALYDHYKECAAERAGAFGTERYRTDIVKMIEGQGEMRHEI